MSHLPSLLGVLDQSLHLNGRAQTFDHNTALLGALPELDSLGVLQLLSALEQRFDIRIADDEVSAELFTSVATLLQFIEHKVAN